MGNQHSSNSEGASGSGGGIRPPRVPFRVGNSLGLSRTELDKRCQPSGLYNKCQWENKAIRRLVGDGKLAARSKGAETATQAVAEECPICFLYYKEVNVTKCCQAQICSECYLQVRPQHQKASCCPFCNAPKLSVKVAKQDRVGKDGNTNTTTNTSSKPETAPTSSTSSQSSNDAAIRRSRSDSTSSAGGFGSSLEQDDRVAAILRKRSESYASSDNSTGPDDTLIQSIAMTEQDRRDLELQMQEQHSHPLALRLQAEAAERRLENERSYYSTAQGQHAMLRNSIGRNRRLMTGGGGRDWFTIVDNYERSGGRPVQSIDDLIVLEAAIVMSIEEEQRRGGDVQNFDAAQHARDGFPLVQSFLESHGVGGRRGGGDQLELLARALNVTSGAFASGGGSRAPSAAVGVGGGGGGGVTGSASAASRAAGGRGRGGGSRGVSRIDTSSLLLRGMTEEEQLEMAIAASLQESSAPSSASSQEQQEGNSSNNNDVDGSADGDGAGNSSTAAASAATVEQDATTNNENEASGANNNGASDETGASQHPPNADETVPQLPDGQDPSSTSTAADGGGNDTVTSTTGDAPTTNNNA